MRKITSTGQLRWLCHHCWQVHKGLEVPFHTRNPKKMCVPCKKTLALLSFAGRALRAISIDLDRLILAHTSSLGEWPTVLWDLWALPRHKGEASLVKSPFSCHTHKYHGPMRKIPSTGQLRWLCHTQKNTHTNHDPSPPSSPSLQS